MFISDAVEVKGTTTSEPSTAPPTRASARGWAASEEGRGREAAASAFHKLLEMAAAASTPTPGGAALSYWAINVVAAFFLSAAHNVLYFVLDLRTPVLHLLHYSSTFLVLLYYSFAQRSFKYQRLHEAPHAYLNIRNLLKILSPAAFMQLFITLLSSRIHSQNRAGSLYLLRFFTYYLQLPLAISASLSWLEFSHIEYDPIAILLTPAIGIAQGVHLILLKKARQLTNHSVDLETFGLCYCGLISVLLSVPALISYFSSTVPYDASWESIDYLLIGMSFIYMPVYKYSELWLISNTDIRSYCVLEHSKYFLASCGQWFLQNMAHATVYAFCGKVMFLASLLRYCDYTRQAIH